MEFCEDPQATSTNILFKINDDEALILKLQSGVLNHGVIGDTIITESIIPGQSQLIYRIFSDAISEDYFCEAIPLVTPTVLKEIQAEDGLVSIETVTNANTTNFVHTLSLSDISLINENGERLTDVNTTVFGEVTTEISTN